MTGKTQKFTKLGLGLLGLGVLSALGCDPSIHQVGGDSPTTPSMAQSPSPATPAPTTPPRPMNPGNPGQDNLPLDDTTGLLRLNVGNIYPDKVYTTVSNQLGKDKEGKDKDVCVLSMGVRNYDILQGSGKDLFVYVSTNMSVEYGRLPDLNAYLKTISFVAPAGSPETRTSWCNGILIESNNAKDITFSGPQVQGTTIVNVVYKLRSEQKYVATWNMGF